ncbi:MAG: hypothetical protein ACRD0V_17635 [Acidimicrobiales bacterium]
MLRHGAGDPRLRTGLVFAGSVTLVAAVRVWQMAGREAVWWNDSAHGAWVERDGRGAFATWLATHPAYLVTEPLRNPSAPSTTPWATAACTRPPINARCRW